MRMTILSVTTLALTEVMDRLDQWDKLAHAH